MPHSCGCASHACLKLTIRACQGTTRGPGLLPALSSASAADVRAFCSSQNGVSCCVGKSSANPQGHEQRRTTSQADFWKMQSSRPELKAWFKMATWASTESERLAPAQRYPSQFLITDTYVAMAEALYQLHLHCTAILRVLKFICHCRSELTCRRASGADECCDEVHKEPDHTLQDCDLDRLLLHKKKVRQSLSQTRLHNVAVVASRHSAPVPLRSHQRKRQCLVFCRGRKRSSTPALRWC